MAIFGGLPTNKPNAGILPRLICRAFVSSERSALGAEVNLHVETRNVADGTDVALEWREMKAEAPAADDTAFDTIQGKIDKCQFVEKAYKLDWEQKELEWTTGKFYFQAKIDSLELELPSNVITVDPGGFSVGS